MLDYWWLMGRRSSQRRPRILHGYRLEEEVLVGPVERLVALCFRVPPDADGQHVRIDRAFQGRKIELQALLSVLLELQPPAGYRQQWRQTQIAFLIFQVFIAAQDFRPFPVGIFRHDDARDDRSRQIVGWRLWH